MSDENKKSDADDKTEEKLEATKKPVVKKKAKAKSSKKTESEGSKNKVVEKLQAMGVMSGGTSKIEEKSDSGKGEFMKIAAASAVAVLVVGSFVWALDKEASNDRAASKFKNAPHSNSYAMQSNYPSQWGPSSMNQNNGAAHGNNQKNYEKQQQRMQQHREQQQKWMQQQQKAFEQQQAQKQKWIDQQKQANADYRTMQQKWINQQRAQQQAYPQHYGQQQMPAHQQQWMEQQRAQQQRFQEQQLAEQKRLQEQQRAQQEKWREQANNSFPPQMNYQGRPVPPAYYNAPGYQQSVPYYRR